METTETEKIKNRRAPLVGRRGVAQTQLRPAGTALFGDTPLNVVTRGDFLAAGMPVRIVAAEGNRLVVEKA